MIVTRDQLWGEFKKSIDTGNWAKFKTRKGMEGHIRRYLKRYPVHELRFYFIRKPGQLLQCTLKISKQELLEAVEGKE